MEKTKWLRLAVSKDKARYSLSEEYRTKDSLVATDGHRLHQILDLPESTPGYPSGLDAVFPDVNQVFPTGKESSSVILPQHWLKNYSELKKLQSFIKSIDNSHQGVMFLYDAKNQSLTLGCDWSEVNIIRFHLNVDKDKSHGESFEVYLNFSFFLDAIALTEESPVTMQVWNSTSKVGKQTSLNPVVFTAELVKCRALVMPLRSDR